MTEKESFLSYLTVLKRKLQVQYVTMRAINGLLVAFGIAILILVAGRIIAIPYLLYISAISAGLVFLATLIIALVKKPRLTDAAKFFDRFVGEDRVETALTFLQDDSNEMIRIQRNDTVQRMRRTMTEVHNMKLLTSKKRISSLVGTGLLIAALVLFPNNTMEQGFLIEKENELVEKTKKELEDLAKEKDSRLQEEQKELSKQLEEANSAEELLQTLLTKEKELNELKKEAERAKKQLMTLSEKSEGLKGMSEALKNLDQDQLKEAMDALKQEELSQEQKNTLKTLEEQMNGSSNSGELSDEEIRELLESLEKSLSEAVASANQLGDIQALQNSLQSGAKSLNSSMQASGMGGVQSLSFANSSSQSSSQGNSSGKSTGSASGNSESADGAGTSGSGGKGRGTGNGTGNGNGTGSGSSSGTGGSSGGTGQGDRGLLTVPDRIGGEGTIEQDSGELGEGSSEMEEAKEAPVLPGSVRSYQEVYGDYEEGYRQSVDRMQLPTHLESLVKQYYSEMNPEGE
ncbi:hypothetical protein [Alkalihalobacillus sp. CinArs1]|uniref:hypothetical protein n=1 Tax=Alkalihalobacillus sp. CinArs1 TaxID=2995314 RepID=UPI0022DD60E9|nr:hypothetical protein [Alkalihalobacillus sp. CinArs1]